MRSRDYFPFVAQTFGFNAAGHRLVSVAFGAVQQTLVLVYRFTHGRLASPVLTPSGLNPLDMAVRKALVQFYPTLEAIKLGGLQSAHHR